MLPLGARIVTSNFGSNEELLLLQSDGGAVTTDGHGDHGVTRQSHPLVHDVTDVETKTHLSGRLNETRLA